MISGRLILTPCSSTRGQLSPPNHLPIFYGRTSCLTVPLRARSRRRQTRTFCRIGNLFDSVSNSARLCMMCPVGITRYSLRSRAFWRHSLPSSQILFTVDLEPVSDFANGKMGITVSSGIRLEAASSFQCDHIRKLVFPHKPTPPP